MGLFSLRRDVQDLVRLRQILAILVREGVHIYAPSALRHAHLHTRAKASISRGSRIDPARMRLLLEALGPTFVKLGQVLSLRPDLVPKEYCDEFRKLQNHVLPIEYAAIARVLEADLRRPLHEVFATFDRTPLASASISQVHRATLHDGTQVVVKVQRPGARDTMARDIDIMEYLARHIEAHYPLTRATSIIEEFKRYTARELDFTFELRALKRFHEHFKDSREVVIPAAFEQYSTPSVLIMEYIAGIPISDRKQVAAAGFSLSALAGVGVRAVFDQVFLFGVFHADPHPGNLLAVRKHGKPALVFLDFGIVGFLEPQLRARMLAFFSSLIDKDPQQVYDALLTFAAVSPATDLAGLRSDVASRIMGWTGTSLRDERMSDLFYDIISDALRRKATFNAETIMLTKAFVTMEGTVSWLNPDANIAGEIAPQIEQLRKQAFSPAALRDKAKASARDVQRIVESLPKAVDALTTRISSGEIAVRMDSEQFRAQQCGAVVAAASRDYAFLGGAFFIGGVLAYAFAPAVQVFSLSLGAWGMLLGAVAILCFLRQQSKNNKYRAP